MKKKRSFENSKTCAIETCAKQRNINKESGKTNPF